METTILSSKSDGGKIIARGISHDEFMAGYPDMHVEWVDGMVIEMAAIEERHDALAGFLRPLFDVYLSLTGGGRVVQDLMVMSLPGVSSRAPDIQVLLPDSMVYHSRMLPKPRLPVALLWRETLPDVLETVELVRKMLTESETKA